MNEFVQVFPENWQKKYEDKGFISPSLIQRAVFQPLSNKQSIVAVSPTGSGKTLAYLWPLLLNVEPGEASALVIFASSQELAIQVADVAREWGKDKELKVQSLVGGANVKRQIEGLKKQWYLMKQTSYLTLGTAKSLIKFFIKLQQSIS